MGQGQSQTQSVEGYAGCSCTPTQIENTINSPGSSPSYITIVGPSCVTVGKYFEVSAKGNWTSGYGSWALNGVVNSGCRNPGCGFYAPSAKGTATVTYTFNGVKGSLEIQVIDPNNCTVSNPPTHIVGDWIGTNWDASKGQGSIPIIKTVKTYDGVTVYMGVEGQYTKMVTENNDAKYLIGTPDIFATGGWPFYWNAQGHYLLSWDSPAPAPAAAPVAVAPATVPLSAFQTMFTAAGCTRQLAESDIAWWRGLPSMTDVQNDMNAYGSLTASGAADARQKEFCKPTTPATAPLTMLQSMFTKAGCSRTLTENDVIWWRGRASMADIQNDMNAYGNLTASGTADARQKEFCKPSAPVQSSDPSISRTGFVLGKASENPMQNSDKLAFLASSLQLKNINSIPKQMANVNASALNFATPVQGALNVTRVDTTNYDSAAAACAKMAFSDIQKMNTTQQVTSTETSCGWLQFSANGAGVGILGTNSRPIGPMPTTVPAGAKYYSPLLTTSAKTADIWANGTMCSGVGSQTSCISESFQGSRAHVNSESATPLESTPIITRDKYIQVDANVGTMAATLYQESQKGMSDESLGTKSSYSIFNKSTQNVHGTDADSWQTSFQTFQPVGNDIYPRLSRDIPVIYGNIEEHDFCAEINEQTIISEDTIGCLQREWIRKGGSPKDVGYPTTALLGSCYGRIRR